MRRSEKLKYCMYYGGGSIAEEHATSLSGWRYAFWGAEHNWVNSSYEREKNNIYWYKRDPATKLVPDDSTPICIKAEILIILWKGTTDSFTTVTPEEFRDVYNEYLAFAINKRNINL